jgi:hypothetical protein
LRFDSTGWGIAFVHQREVSRVLFFAGGERKPKHASIEGCPENPDFRKRREARANFRGPGISATVERKYFLLPRSIYIATLFPLPETVANPSAIQSPVL